MGVLNPGEGPPFFCHWGKSCEIVLPGLEGQQEEGKDSCLGGFLYKSLYRRLNSTTIPSMYHIISNIVQYPIFDTSFHGSIVKRSNFVA